MCRLDERWFLGMLALLFGAAGCSPAPTLPKSFPARGTVVYKGGQPVKGGTIEFKSDADPLLRVVGQIDDHGAFRLTTIKDAQTDGAPEGEYTVIVTPPRPAHAPGDMAAAHRPITPIALEQTYKVEAKENTFKIELPMPPP